MWLLLYGYARETKLVLKNGSVSCVTSGLQQLSCQIGLDYDCSNRSTRSRNPPFNSSQTNYETLEFWKRASQSYLCWFSFNGGIGEIRKRTDVELSLWCGAMCISYSGRCTLSNHMICVMPAVVVVLILPLKYDLYDMPLVRNVRVLKVKFEEFSMSARWYVHDWPYSNMIENSVDSLRIEGRMKSIHQQLTQLIYKAVDAYLESPEKFEAIKQDLWARCGRLLSVNWQQVSTMVPTEKSEQLFGARRKNSWI